MSKREVASLACKILGIYTVIQGINAIASMLSVSFTTPNQMAPGNLANIIVPFIFLLIFGVLLWLLSDKISVVMVKGETHFNGDSGMRASDLQNIAFSVLGLFFLGNSIPRLISLLTSFYSMREVPDNTEKILLGGIGIITQLIIGLGIFFGSRGLVNFLNTLRSAGIKRNNDYEE